MSKRKFKEGDIVRNIRTGAIYTIAKYNPGLYINQRHYPYGTFSRRSSYTVRMEGVRGTYRAFYSYELELAYDDVQWD